MKDPHHKYKVVHQIDTYNCWDKIQFAYSILIKYLMSQISLFLTVSLIRTPSLSRS